MRTPLRALIDHATRPAEPDAVLLRKFVAARDPEAFAEVVRRYGRLVWGQCKNLLSSEADADDAFQATFLTLARSARTVKDSNKLGPWLHGVAYRVCQNSKRRAARRNKREKATARSEATKPVADSAWDAAFAAVHHELAQLPDTLRVPFVLCVLEGKGTTEAAAQLGLKLGTFSARLSRAKQAMFERLSSRGLTAGLAAVGAVAVGASSVPAAVAGRACDLAAGGAVPPNILSLSHGVLSMAAMNAKRWVMAVVAAGGLAVGLGGAWQANAQTPGVQKEVKELLEEKRTLEAIKEKARADEAKLKAEKLGKVLRPGDPAFEEAKAEAERLDAEVKKLADLQRDRAALVLKASPEFLYFGQAAGFAPTAAELEATVKQLEAKGYTFVGVVTMKGQTKAKDGEAVPTLVFRKAASQTWGKLKEGKVVEVEVDVSGAQEKVLMAQIDRLTRELADLKAKDAKKPAGAKAVFQLAEVGGDYEAFTKLVTGLVKLKFGDAGKLKFTQQDAAVIVEGCTKEQAQWLLETLADLAGKKGK